MKTVYKKISIGSRNFMLTISLLVSLIAMASGEAASGAVNVESLDGLQVSLVSPNVSGAEKLTTDNSKAHYYAGNDNDLVCHLNNLAAGTHRLTVKVTLGTNTYVLAVVDIVVAANANNETAEDSMNLTAVKSFGDGSGVPVPACYGVDGDDNAHITTPLSIGDAAAGGEGAVASGRADDTSGNIEATGAGSQAFGIGTKAIQDAQMVVGMCNVPDEDGSFQFIVGNGADNDNRHNAFAVTVSGELALFKADGTPVILTAAQLEALIASLPSA